MNAVDAFFHTGGFIRITSVPSGGAPNWVREQWVGLVLPIAERSDGPLADVMTGRKVDRKGGWAINWGDAMEALGQNSPEAQLWWALNINPMTLVFTDDCCEVVPS